MQDFIKEIVDRDFYFHHSLNVVPENNSFNLHMHDAFEIYYFISGNARMNIEDRFYDLSPLDLCFIYPGHFHRVIPDTSFPYERKVIRFDYSFSRSFDPNDTLINSLQNFNILRGRDIKKSQIDALFNEIPNFMAYTNDLRRIGCISILSRLMLEISGVHEICLAPVPESPSNERVASIIEYINDNLSEDLSLDKISSKFFISKFYLSRIFKQNTGSSIGDFIIKKRLVLAKRLMIGGSTPGNACIQSGFSDYSSFYKSYKKYFGTPPSG
jgi:AraC-like DNA-binding protein